MKRCVTTKLLGMTEGDYLNNKLLRKWKSGRSTMLMIWWQEMILFRHNNPRVNLCLGACHGNSTPDRGSKQLSQYVVCSPFTIIMKANSTIPQEALALLSINSRCYIENLLQYFATLEHADLSVIRTFIDSREMKPKNLHCPALNIHNQGSRLY